MGSGVDAGTRRKAPIFENVISHPIIGENAVTRLASLAILLLFSLTAYPQETVLDEMDSSVNWSIYKAEGVGIDTSTVAGQFGKCLKIDFDFVTGGGYGGVAARFPIEYGDNYRFTFWVKGNAPDNNFEFKITDDEAENVWWVNRQNFHFPEEWQQITVRKRHLDFAWGPTEDRTLHKSGRLEFIIASSNGGKGSVYIDRVSFEALPPARTKLPLPQFTISSNSGRAAALSDDNEQTTWKSDGKTRETIEMDLGDFYEFGGVKLYWHDKNYPKRFNVAVSQDGKSWANAYKVEKGRGGRQFLYMPESEARYLRLTLLESAGEAFEIRELKILDLDFSETRESYFSNVAKSFPRGYFPRYAYGEQPYWTIVGVNNDSREAMINEEGMVEVDKTMFSIEPFVYDENGLRTWADVNLSQALAEDYLPIPSVNWETADLRLTTQIFADGAAGESVLYAEYTLTNLSPANRKGNLYLAIRPFQVNSPWQFLNWPGGVARVESISMGSKWQDGVLVNGQKRVLPLDKPDGFGAVNADEGPVVWHLAQNKLPENREAKDRLGFAGGAFRYAYNLKAGKSLTVRLAVPFHSTDPAGAPVVDSEKVPARRAAVADFWRQKINTVDFQLPASGMELVNLVRSNLAYILINRDGAGIQPGSRSYERSWIRDGSLTSSALLKLGVREEVHDFLDWYAPYQFESGKVPCVVDRRGPTPTPEHDSHGQLIFGLYQYFLFTGDTAFLAKNFSHVVRAVAYMDTLVAQRSTTEYQVEDPDMAAKYGLFPESISHEGYSAKPMHSFWDTFFGMKGYKDAVEIARVLGDSLSAQKFRHSRDTFRKNLYRAIDLSIAKENIDYIPGCVELGDFDATSTAIAIYPCNELPYLPQPYAGNTFDRYFDYFSKRRDPAFEWRDYTPYEVRLIGTFVYLGQRDRAHALIDFFKGDLRPRSWNHWAEVVRKGYRTPGFIGDMPHTWVGSDFISAVRAMFVYEDEPNRSLKLGAGLYRDWVDNPDGMSVGGLPTYYGVLGYSVTPTPVGYRIEIAPGVDLPAGGIQFSNPRSEMPSRVTLNGKEQAVGDGRWFRTDTLPATFEIDY